VTAARLAALEQSDTRARHLAARLDLHGVVRDASGETRLARDVESAIDAVALDAVAAHHAGEPDSAGLLLADVRPMLALALRRLAAIDAKSANVAIDDRLAELVSAGRLARDGDRVRDPARAPGLPPAVDAAMDRLVGLLAVNGPPPLSEVARVAGCPPEGVRMLEASGRIVRLEPDLAYEAETFAELAGLASSLARARPLTPAAFRDATGTSRRYVMTLLEEFGRRRILVRTEAGHVPGPRAGAA